MCSLTKVDPLDRATRKYGVRTTRLLPTHVMKPSSSIMDTTTATTVTNLDNLSKISAASNKDENGGQGGNLQVDDMFIHSLILKQM